MQLKQQCFSVQLVNVVNSGIDKFVLKLVNYSIKVKAGEVFLWQGASSFLNHIRGAVNNLPAVHEKAT